MFTDSSFLKLGLILFCYFAFMLGKSIYSGRVKAPKMIKYFQSIGNKEKEAEWERYMKKCRSDYIWIYAMLLIIQILFFCLYGLTVFFGKLASGQIP